MTTYWEKLKDPRWQKKRLEILERDGWTCDRCGEKGNTLHVHHGYYEKNLEPWDYDPETLHTVCEYCHDGANELRRDLQYEVARLRLDVQKELLYFVSDLKGISANNAIELLNEANPSNPPCSFEPPVAVTTLPGVCSFSCLPWSAGIVADEGEADAR